MVKAVVRILPVALLVMAAVLPHLPAASETSRFVYDDREFVQQNASIRSIGAAIAAFSSPFPPEQPARGLYRPLTALSYAVDYSLFGVKPAAFHRSNIALYLLVTLLLYLLFCRLLGSRLLAASGALLFAAHPVHCEAVDSIAGRSELLSLAFALAALLLFIWALERERRRFRAVAVGASSLLYLGAALSKESGVVLLGVLAAALLFRIPKGGESSEGERTHTRKRWADAWLLLPFGAVAGGYLLLRMSALSAGLIPSQTILGGQALGTKLATIGTVMAHYLGLLVLPLDLQVDLVHMRTVGVQSAFSATAALGLAVLFAAAAALSWLAWRALKGRLSEPKTAALALGLSLLLAFLFPVSHVVPFGALMAERFLFAPSVGFILLVVAGLARYAAHRPQLPWNKLGVAAAALFVIFGAVRSYARSGEWRDAVTLWRPVASQLKDDHRVANSLAAGYLERGNSKAAIAWFRRSLALKPGFSRAAHNLAMAYVRQGRHRQAAQTLRALVARHPKHALGHNSLGLLAARQGRLREAQRHYRRALKLNPNYATAKRNLALLRRPLAAARAFVAKHLPRLESTVEPRRLHELRQACAALENNTCAQRVMIRWRQLGLGGTR